jgi:hypothetical protein
MKPVINTDSDVIQMLRAKSTRQVLAEFVAALGQLVIHLHLEADLPDLSVNFHGRAMRLDVAQLTPDGQHLARWLLGLNANVLDPAFGARVDLPDTGGPVQ